MTLGFRISDAREDDEVSFECAEEDDDDEATEQEDMRCDECEWL